MPILSGVLLTIQALSYNPLFLTHLSYNLPPPTALSVTINCLSFRLCVNQRFCCCYVHLPVCLQTLYRSLQSMLEYTGDDMEDVFMQTFQVGYTDVFGANLTHDLRPDGAQQPVNSCNVQVSRLS